MKPKPAVNLDELVTDNAVLWLKRRIAAYRVQQRDYTLWTLAAEMLPHLHPPEERTGKENLTNIQARIRLTVGGYLGFETRKGKVKAPWRLDYLEAFCAAIEVRPQALLAPRPTLTPAELQFLDEVAAQTPWLSRLARKKSAVRS